MRDRGEGTEPEGKRKTERGRAREGGWTREGRVTEGYLFAFGKQRVWAALYACPLFRVTKDEGSRSKVFSRLLRCTRLNREFMLEILISTALHSHAGAF